MPNRSIVSPFSQVQNKLRVPKKIERTNKAKHHFTNIMTAFRVLNSILFIGIFLQACESFSFVHPSSCALHHSPLFGTSRSILPISTRSLHLKVPILQSISDIQEDNEQNQNKLLSLTAFKASVKLSVSAMRTTLRGLTGISVTSSMKAIVGLFPTWVSTTPIN